MPFVVVNDDGRITFIYLLMDPYFSFLSFVSLRVFFVSVCVNHLFSIPFEWRCMSPFSFHGIGQRTTSRPLPQLHIFSLPFLIGRIYGDVWPNYNNSPTDQLVFSYILLRSPFTYSYNIPVCQHVCLSDPVHVIQSIIAQ